jgi:hypothetical protein
LPVAEKESLPPFMLTTSFSHSPMSMENGAGSSRSKRTRKPLAVVVKTSAPPPPLTSTVSMPATAFVEIRVVARIPNHAIIALLAADLIIRVAAGHRVIARATEQEIDAALAEQRVVIRAAIQRIATRTARERVVARPHRTFRPCGSAPLASLRVNASFPFRPKMRMSVVFATVGVPPDTDHRTSVHEDSVPRHSGSQTMTLSRSSPITVSTPVIGSKLAVMTCVAAGRRFTR